MFWKRRSKMGKAAIVTVLAVLLLCACSSLAAMVDGTAEPTPTVVAQAVPPTYTPTPALTYTSRPATPAPTATASPILAPTHTIPAPTPTLTDTPALPTATLAPTATPSPAPTAIPPTATALPPTATPLPVATATSSAFAGMTPAQVVEVVDGDTIKVSIEGQVYTVRYIAVDTPETVHPSKPVQWMGPEASAANKALVEGQTVYLEKDVSETDKYGRLLRYVWLPDGRMVNEELCRRGYAQVSTYPPDVKYQDRFLAAVQEAREAGRGLWSATPGPTLPPAATPEPPTLPEAPTGQSPVQITEHRGGSTPEYITITNTGSDTVDLTGWKLHSVRGDQWFSFPAGTVLPPGASLRVYSATDSAPADGILWTAKNMWNNDGDEARLIDPTGAVVSVAE